MDLGRFIDPKSGHNARTEKEKGIAPAAIVPGSAPFAAAPIGSNSDAYFSRSSAYLGCRLEITSSISSADGVDIEFSRSFTSLIDSIAERSFSKWFHVNKEQA